MANTSKLRALAEAAFPGPWGWFGSTYGNIYLAARHSGRRCVMTFCRLGMGDAQPMFQVDQRMVKAQDLAIFEVCPEAASADDPRVYRRDLISFRSPDATYIAAADPSTILALIEDGERLRAALADLLAEVDLVNASGRMLGEPDTIQKAACDKARAALRGI